MYNKKQLTCGMVIVLVIKKNGDNNEKERAIIKTEINGDWKIMENKIFNKESKIKSIKNKVIAATMTVFLVSMAMPIVISAADPIASITGPASTRAGETITVSVFATGDGVSEFRGEISYNSDQLAFKNTDGGLIGWNTDVKNATFGTVTFFCNNNEIDAISGKTKLFNVTFSVKSQVAKGAKIDIKAGKMTAKTGVSSFSVDSTSYSVTVAEPLSSNVMLSVLTVGNATIAPIFNSTMTNYTTSVPFEITQLDITATAQDPKSEVLIEGNTLIAGEDTTVNVTVISESGSKRIYSIRAKRAQDPNYKTSNNSSLSDILIDGVSLSPAFSSEIITYTALIPSEISKVNVSAKAVDEKAKVVVIGGDALIPGYDNTIKVVCTAEDGATKEYTIIAKRANLGGSVIGNTSIATQNTPVFQGVVSTNRAPTWVIILIALVCCGVVFGGWWFFNYGYYRFARSQEDEDEDNIYF